MGKLTGNDVIMKEQRVMKWTETENGAYLFPGCVVTGDVTMGKAASVWYNAVVRGDMAPITIGEGSNIQDNAVVHVDNGFPTVIGNGVTIGHGAIVHGCTVEDDCIIGMGAVLLNGARIGKKCIIGAGTLVPEGKEVPEGSVSFGNPVRVYRPVNEEDIKHIHANAAEYVEYAGEGKGEYN